MGSGGLKPVSDRDPRKTRGWRISSRWQIDRETKQAGDHRTTQRLLSAVEKELDGTDAIVVGDYNKGVVTQELLEGLRALCRPRGFG